MAVSAATPAAEAAPAARVPQPPHDPAALWIRALSTLPLGALYVIAGAVAWLGQHVLRYRVAVARDNLERCFPDYSRTQIKRLLTLYYRHLGQVIAEFFKVATMSAEELSSRVTLVNLEAVHAQTRAGRSVLLLGAHFCNWEWSLHGVALRVEVPMEAGYKPLHNAAADRELRKLRCRFGAHLIAAKRLPREIARRRDTVRALALIADQVPVAHGRLWVKFLGRSTPFYDGPGQIAHSTGYAAFFAAMTRTRRGYYQIEFQPICTAGECLDVRTFTARYARLLEALILEHPSDWTWTHRRWKLPCLQELTDAQTAAE